MKNLISLFLISWLTLGILWAQNENVYEVPLSEPGKPAFLDVKIHNGKITVIGEDRNDMEVEIGRSDDSDHIDKRNKYGMKRISNNSIGFEISEEGNTVYVNTNGNNKEADVIVRVPKDCSLKLRTHHNGDVFVENVSGSLEIDSHHGGVEFKNVSGSAIVDTHHGAIRGTFSSIDKDQPMAFSTYHGDVDITFPAGVAADAKMKTSQGEIYTDFEMDVKPQNKKNATSNKTHIKVEGWVYGNLGSGGPEYMFTTYHGDVVIRKG